MVGCFAPAAAQENPVTSPSTFSEEQDYAFALGLYQDSLFQLAGQQFESFVIKYPNSIKRQEVAFLGCECFFQSSQFQNAEIKYLEFVRDYPNSRYIPEANLRLGQSYIGLGKYDKAVVTLKTVLDKSGETSTAGEAAYWIGEAYLRNDDTQTAIKYYTIAFENYPKNRLRDYALYSVAWTHQKRAEYAKAAEWYEKLISEFPQSTLTSGAHVRIGECFYYAKDYKQAIDVLKKSRAGIQDEEESGNADYLTAEAFYKLGDIAAAQKCYEQFIAAHPKHKLMPEVTYVLGWSYLSQKNYTKAVTMFNTLIDRTDGIGHAALYQRSVAERLTVKPDLALKTLHEVLRREPQGDWSDNALFDIGMIFFEENNANKAKLYFERVTKDFPKSDILPEGCRMFGECLLIENNFKDAQAWFEKAITIPTASFEVKVDAGFQSALCFFKLKQYKDAAAKFSSFILQYPNHPKSEEAKYFQAEAEYRLGNYNQSIQLYQEAINGSYAPKKEESLYGLAWSYYKQGKFQQAIGSFERLLVAYPKGKFSFDARLRMGDAYFFLKDYKKAIDNYRRITRLYVDSISIDYAYYQIGQSFFKDGNNTEAFKAFDGLISTLPKSQLADDAQFAKGWINFQRKEYGEAVKEFQKLIKMYPGSELVPRAYYSIGDSYYNIQRYSEAEKSYTEVLRQFPQSSYVADAITGIQYCLVAQGKNAEAVRVIDDFAKEHPNSPAAIELKFKKGELLFSQKKYGEASKVYEKFVEQNPGSKQLAQARYMLGMSYRAQGKIDEALIAFEDATKSADVSEEILGGSLFETAEIYDSQHKPDKSINILKHLQERTKNPEILAEAGLRIGQSMQLSGNTKDARIQFGQVIREFSDLPVADEARIALARLCFQSGEYDSAKAVAQKVATSHKDELGAEAQYIVGASLAGKKEWTNVITALLRVKYLFPSYERWVGRAYLGLGDAYEQTKDIRSAREAYQSVLKLNTDGVVIEEAKQRLKRMEHK